jgi:hypothetical protein
LIKLPALSAFIKVLKLAFAMGYSVGAMTDFSFDSTQNAGLNDFPLSSLVHA